jgi:hypothetical protein
MNNLFSSNKNSILLSAKNAVNLFSKAVEALEKVNEQATKLAIENEAKIAAMQADNNELQVVVTKNNKIMKNINKLLED